MDQVRTAAARVPDTMVVGDPVDRLPHVVTFSCLFVDGEALVHELDRRGFAVASGSACTASTLEPSHVLAAMGVLTHGNVRVTLPLAAAVSGGDAARAAGVRAFCDQLPDAVATVRAQRDRPAVSSEREADEERRGRRGGRPRAAVPDPGHPAGDGAPRPAGGVAGPAARDRPGGPVRRGRVLPDAGSRLVETTDEPDYTAYLVRN